MSDQFKFSQFERNRSSTIASLLNKGEPEASGITPIRKAADKEYFGYTFDKGGDHSISAAIDFHLADGSSFGVFYFGILTPIRYTPGSNGSAQQISIKTQSLNILIAGKNLYSVYEYLLEQRLVWMKEADSSFIEESPDKIIIEKIELEERDA